MEDDDVIDYWKKRLGTYEEEPIGYLEMLSQGPRIRLDGLTHAEALDLALERLKSLR